MVSSAFTARSRLMNILCDDNAKLDSRIRRTRATVQRMGANITRTMGERGLIVQVNETVVHSFIYAIDTDTAEHFLSVMRDDVSNGI